MTTPLLLPGNGAFPAVGYLHPTGTEDDVKAASHWVVADFDSPVRTCVTCSLVHHLNPSCVMQLCHTGRHKPHCALAICSVD